MATHTEQFSERAREFTLASVLASYPDADFELTLGDLSASLLGHEGAGALASAFGSPNGIDGIRSSYIDLFDRGKDRASLYETEYGRMRGMAKGNDLADIAGFYQAFGFTMATDDVHEMHDHLAVELEFYAVLLLKQQALAEIGDAEGLEIVEDARRKFVVDHLGRLARAISERREVMDDVLYGPVFAWCWKLVSRECAGWGIEPPLLDYFGDDELKRDMACGAVHLPVLKE